MVVDKIPLDDPECYQLIARGDTAGIFQFESSGFTEFLKRLKPTRFEDIIAAGAIYRPGPLESGVVDDYIARKHGRARVIYPHPKLEAVLQETYGCIVYQEQVMQISQVLAGFTLGRADILRRAMGKKKAEEMNELRASFCEGAASNGVEPRVAGEIFDLMEKFAGYGFNKSHAAAYALITVQTAWLKAHYLGRVHGGALLERSRQHRQGRRPHRRRTRGRPSSFAALGEQVRASFLGAQGERQDDPLWAWVASRESGRRPSRRSSRPAKRVPSPASSTSANGWTCGG